MIVLVIQRDGSRMACHTGVESIVENDDLEIVLVTDHSEDIVVDRDTQRIDIVGVD